MGGCWNLYSVIMRWVMPSLFEAPAQQAPRPHASLSAEAEQELAQRRRSMIGALTAFSVP